MNDERTRERSQDSRETKMPDRIRDSALRELVDAVERLTTRVELLEARLRRIENPLADYKPAPGMGKIADLPLPVKQPSDGSDDWRTPAERRGESKVIPLAAGKSNIIPMTTGDLKPVGPMELGYADSLWHRRPADRAPRPLPKRGEIA